MFDRFTSVVAASKLALVVLFALVAAFPARAGEDVAALIARVLDAYGGRDRLEAVRGYHATGTTSSVRTGSIGRSQRWLIYPNRLRIDIAYSPTHVESRILDGSRAWSDGQPAREAFRAAMALQAARLRLPLLLAERPVSDIGEFPEMGRPLRVLGVDVGGGIRIEVAIDPESGFIERSHGFVDVGDLTVNFATHYGDFRVVDGVVFAHREKHIAMGMETGETVLSRVELNPEIPPDVFHP